MSKDQGLSLLDIGPLCEDVPVNDEQSIRVYGVSARGVFAIFQRFPEVGSWFKGGKIDTSMLVKETPDAIAAVIAAGCGTPGDEAAEANADKLPVETQLDLIEAIGRLTFRSGFGPFVNRIVALSAAAQSLNFGRASVTTLPQGSKPVSPQATAANQSGN